MGSPVRVIDDIRRRVAPDRPVDRVQALGVFLPTPMVGMVLKM